MRKFFVAAIMVGAAILGTATPAQATFIKIYLQQDGVNGGAITEVGSGADFTAASFTGTYGDFFVRIQGGSSSNGSSLSDLLNSVNRVHNTSGTTKTLRVYVSQDDYTLPTGSILSVESSLGGTLVAGTTVGTTGIFQAFADSGNSLLGMSDFTNGPQNANLTGSSFDTGSKFGSFNRTGNYSLTSVATLTVSGDGQAGYQSQVNVTPTPAPAGVVLALTGLPFLGIGTWLRRRKAMAQNS